MNYRRLTNLRVKNKTVLIRTDFNVPIEDGKIQDDSRIKAAAETIKCILKKEPKRIVIASHLGRPKGKYDEEFSLSPVAKRLTQILKRKVVFIDDCLGEITEGNIVMLENLRFYSGEKENDKGFAKQLAEKADVYVNDAFGTFHRKHASVDAITNYLPSSPGLLVEKELKAIKNATHDIKKPYVAVLGAAKISNKMKVLENLLKKVDYLLLGGGMVFTFMRAKGYDTGKSLVEEDMIPYAKKLFQKYPKKIILPYDFIVTNSLKNPTRIERVIAEKIRSNMAGVDIGPQSIGAFKVYLSTAKTIVWNGPMGLFEVEPFDNATNQIAEFIAKLKATTIVGGGDTVSAIHNSGVAEKMTHISTGGGAFLESLAGKKLPGISALERNFKKF